MIFAAERTFCLKSAVRSAIKDLRNRQNHEKRPQILSASGKLAQKGGADRIAILSIRFLPSDPVFIQLARSWFAQANIVEWASQGNRID